jgi:hypothetical protein
MSRSTTWARRLLIAATLALSGALALAGPAAAKYIW